MKVSGKKRLEIYGDFLLKIAAFLSKEKQKMFSNLARKALDDLCNAKENSDAPTLLHLKLNVSSTVMLLFIHVK